MNSSDNEIWAILGAYLGLAIAALCFTLIIQVVVCWYLSTCIAKIPESHRQLAPGAPWIFLAAFVFSLVPCFGHLGSIFLVIYNFFFWPKLSRSFKSYFDSTGETSVGDCGEKIAMIYCIGHAIMAFVAFWSWIPYIGLIAILGACGIGAILFVFWVILLVKAGQYKGMIPDLVDGTPEFPISNTQG